MHRYGRRRAGWTLALTLALSPLASSASAETLHIGARNCYDAFDTWLSATTVAPGQYVEQHLDYHVNWNIRNRCDPNSWVIDGTYTTGAVWHGGTHKGNGGPRWSSKYNGGWHRITIGYWAPTSIGTHEMRAYILSSQFTFPSPSFYNGAARAWLTVLAPPSPPQNARSAPLGEDRVRVSWDAPASDGGRAVTAYDVFRDGQLRARLGGGARTYDDGLLRPSECHTYWVRAVNERGSSGDSNHTRGCALADSKPPVVTHVVAPPHHNGWYNRVEIIDWRATDPYNSSGTPTDPPSTPIDRLGTHPYRGTSCDPAGNCATGEYVASFDDQAPTLAATLDPAANEAGWHRGDVTVRWACADAVSGVDPGTCPESSVLTGDGEQQATGTVLDVAGNSATATAVARIDTLAPATTSGDSGDWHGGDVTVELTAADERSGIAATYWRLDGGDVTAGASVPVAGHGVHTLEYWSVDVAGNVEPANTAPVRIDTVAPTISASVDPLPSNDPWHNTAFTLSWTCADADSGIVACTASKVIAIDGVHVETGTAIDAAGNKTTAEREVLLDTTAPALEPVVSPAAPDGDNGWYRSPVTVSWLCDPAGSDLSGVASCSGSTTTSGEGRGVVIEGEAVDVAGNRATATAGPFDIDLAPAQASVPQPTVGGGLGAPVARELTGTATDSMSGVTRVELRFVEANNNDPNAPGRVVAATCSGCGPGATSVSWSLSTSGLPAGAYRVAARALDHAGYVGPWSAEIRVVVVGN